MPEAREETRRLGRGLSALLGDIAEPPANGADAAVRAQRLPIEALRPSAANPRSAFPDEALAELAQSIAEHGILQPILVRSVGAGYEIVAGERRWRAAQQAGLHEVPVIVRELSASEALQIAIIENVQRADLNPIEEAMGYAKLIEEFGHRQDALGKLIGKSRSHVANTLRLLNLPASIRASVVEGSLSAGHARALLGAADPEALADEVMRRGLSVRATEALVASASRPPEPRTTARFEDADTRALVRRLSARLGLKVSLAHNADESGTLTIKYTSLDQLDALCKQLGEG